MPSFFHGASKVGKRKVLTRAANYLLEYTSIIKYVAPSLVIFSRCNFEVPDSWSSLENFSVAEKSISEHSIPIEKICLLDSEAPDTLSPDDSALFSHFLFGGILGNSTPFPNYHTAR